MNIEAGLRVCRVGLQVVLVPALLAVALAQEAARPPVLPWEEPLLGGPIYSTRELLWKSSLVVGLKVDKAGEVMVERVHFGEWKPSEPPPFPRDLTWPKEALRGIAFYRSIQAQYQLQPSGLRVEGGGDTVEVVLPGSPPRQLEGASWSDLLRTVRRDGDAIAQLKTAWVEPNAGKRISLLREWIDREERSFAGGLVEGRAGWGSLEAALLMEMIDQGSLTEAWKAVGIYARANQGHLPPCGKAFGTTDGRRFLLDIWDGKLSLEGDRIRALKLLALKGVWDKKNEGDDSARFHSALTEALAKKEGPLFDAALEIVARPGPGFLPPMIAAQLVELYKTRPPGENKNRIARALAPILGEAEWKRLSGNPGLLVVAITQWSLEQERLLWKCERIQGSLPAAKAFFLREKVDDSGKVLETGNAPLREMDNPPWDFSLPVRGDAPVTTWNSGLWRIKIVGGDPKSPQWQSEPRFLKVVKPLFRLPIGKATNQQTKVLLDPPIER